MSVAFVAVACSALWRSRRLKWSARIETQADRDEGVRPGPTSDEQAENRELRRRVRLLEHENEVLRRAAAYLSQASLPGK
jgi:transposase-like protein